MNELACLPADLLGVLVELSPRPLRAYCGLIGTCHTIRRKLRGTLAQITFDCLPPPTVDAFASLVAPCRQLQELKFRPMWAMIGGGYEPLDWVSTAFLGHESLRTVHIPTTAGLPSPTVLRMLEFMPGLEELDACLEDSPNWRAVFGVLAARCPRLARLRLRMEGTYVPVPLAAIAALPGLRCLQMACNRLAISAAPPDGAPATAPEPEPGPELEGIWAHDLAWAGAGAADHARAAALLRPLRELHLSGPSEATMQLLLAAGAGGAWGGLERLDLRVDETETWRRLAGLLPRLGALRVVALTSVPGFVAEEVLGALARLPALRELVMDDCCYGWHQLPEATLAALTATLEALRLTVRAGSNLPLHWVLRCPRMRTLQLRAGPEAHFGSDTSSLLELTAPRLERFHLGSCGREADRVVLSLACPALRALEWPGCRLLVAEPMGRLARLRATGGDRLADPLGLMAMVADTPSLRVLAGPLPLTVTVFDILRTYQPAMGHLTRLEVAVAGALALPPGARLVVAGPRLRALWLRLSPEHPVDSLTLTGCPLLERCRLEVRRVGGLTVAGAPRLAHLQLINPEATGWNERPLNGLSVPPQAALRTAWLIDCVPSAPAWVGALLGAALVELRVVVRMRRAANPEAAQLAAGPQAGLWEQVYGALGNMPALRRLELGPVRRPKVVLRLPALVWLRLRCPADCVVHISLGCPAIEWLDLGNFSRKSTLHFLGAPQPRVACPHLQVACVKSHAWTALRASFPGLIFKTSPLLRAAEFEPDEPDIFLEKDEDDQCLLEELA
ncbi:hypothetical protein PAPYR_9452 [Paratrimastix pyriformis]|uniref:Uncharacterized protein n=1 Tax=Paratrimastix pyriformis TaxID=342808 RepID=A0ABQ8U8C2_9EUKA|nr:hypothetical protein PAPYR_9452 [Paratrimastix pyriformis]